MIFNKDLKKLNWVLLGGLCTGIILRVVSNIFLPNAPDAYSYYESAIGILSGNYNTSRFPTYPFYLIPFLLLISDIDIALKTASFTASILLIVSSYIIFSRLSIYYKKEEIEINKKTIALLICFYISINYYLIYNAGRALREELIMVLFILFIYYFFMENKTGKKFSKNESILIFLTSSLCLIHITVGIFLSISIILYFLISKLPSCNFRIRNFKILLVLITSVLSYSFWFIFCLYRFGDPFYSFHTRANWFKGNTFLDLTSIQGILEATKNALLIGHLREFLCITDLIGIIFTFFLILSFFWVKDRKEIFFIYLLIGVNFLFLGFIMSVGDIRLLIYLLPFMFFVGSLEIINLFQIQPDYIEISFTIFNKKKEISIGSLFLIYLVIYSIANLLKSLYYIFRDAYYTPSIILNSISDYIFFFHEFVFFIFIIFLYNSYKYDQNLKLHLTNF